MRPTHELRRSPRIPLACTATVRDKRATWCGETRDIGARGCRLALTHPLARGALVQPRFERGGELSPLEAVGQVVWTRADPGLSAGVAFVGLPRGGSGAQARSWVDDLVAVHLRGLLGDWDQARGALAKLGEVKIELGLPPAERLVAPEVALVRLVREGAALAEACRSRDQLAVLVSLLERGALSVCLPNPDPAGWWRALAQNTADSCTW